jgi:outer membrane receptor protein involved in Fe transport
MKQKQFQHIPVRAAVAAILGTVAVHSPVAWSAEEATEDALEEVTVTGSRILRRDFESPSPIVTVGSELFEQTGSVAVEKALNQLPQFVPSQTMFSSADVQPSAFNNPGIVTLNLRGLGANRNLVLIDGRRPQPANASLVVDINSIPAAAIESVEIISGGASATYGADAMGGVTNFKMKRNFQGLSLNAQTSFTEEGGGRETTISALLGGNFGDGKGNAMLGMAWTERQALMAADRKFYVEGWRDANTPGAEGIPFSNIQFAANNRPTPGAYAAIGLGTAGAGEGVFVNPDGTLFLNSPGNPARGYTGPLNDEFKRQGTGTTGPGILTANNLNTIITTPLTRYSIFGNAHYDLTEKTSVFMQANVSSMSVDTILNYAPATSQWAVTIPVDGRALPAQLASLLASRPNSTYCLTGSVGCGAPGSNTTATTNAALVGTLNPATGPNAPYTVARTMDFAGPRSTQNNTDTYQVLTGLRGDIFETDWNYEAYVSHGKTSLLTEMNGFPGLQNYQRVAGAPNFGRNLTVGSGPPLFFELKCTTGLPIVSYFTPSQDCVDAISGNMKHLTETKQNIAEANVTGDLFELPAGTIGSAWGASWRENTYRWRPDDQLTRPSTNYPIGLFPTSKTQGRTTVKELYGELLVPVLKDLPAFRRLNLEVGARWSDYNTAGSIWTYKGLVDWTVVDSMRIRGGYQLANRAPNVAELFTGATTSVVGFPGADPCLANTLNPWGNTPLNTTTRTQAIALCSALINRSRGDVNQSPWHTLPLYPNNIVGPFPNAPFQLELANITGNVALRNEEAKTWTVGVVFSSPFEGIFSNATLAVDWYKVDIKDAIAPTNPLSVYQKCFNVDGSNPSYDVNNEFCRLITRDSDGYRATVDTPYSNLGGIQTSGIDVQFNWAFPLLAGRMNVNSVVNFLDYYRDQVSPADAFIESTGTFRSGGQYEYRILTTLNYSQGAWSAGLRHRFLPSIKDAAFATNPNTTVLDVGAYGILDAFGSYSVNDRITVRGGIDNVTDRAPPRVGINPGTTAAAGTTNAQFYDVLGRRFYMSIQLNL